MSKSIPVVRFLYAYVTTGILAGETIEIEETSEAKAAEKARAKLDRNGLQAIGLRLLSATPTGSKRSAA